jgi:ribosome-associated protein
MQRFAATDRLVKVPVQGEIKLDRFLKWSNISVTGGQSKILIMTGEIKVNGQVEKRRGRLLREGDIIQFKETEYFVFYPGEEC